MTRNRRRWRLAAASVVVLAGGCGGAVTPDAEQLDPTAMEEYGCGYGFWLGSPDGHVAVRLAAAHQVADEGDLPRESTLPHEAWDATVLVGEDLYANWCDDVLEPGEPRAEVDDEWPITAGRLTLQDPVPTPGCPGEAHATVSGLEATRSDGTVVDLGSRELTNDAWGCFAG